MEIKKGGIASFILFMGIYGIFLKSFPMPTAFCLLGPFVFIKFVNVNKGNYIAYAAVAILFALGVARVSAYASLVFAFIVILPAMILMVFHKVNEYPASKEFTIRGNPVQISNVSPLGVMLAPMPAVLALVILYLAIPGMQEQLISNIAQLIEAGSAQIRDNVAATPDVKSMFDFIYNNRVDMAERLIYLGPGMLYAIIALVIFFTQRYSYGLHVWDIFKPNEWFVGLLVVATIFIKYPGGAFVVAGTNILIVVGAIYFCRGLDVLAFTMAKLSIILPLRVFTYMIVFMDKRLMVILAIAGLVTVYWEVFRRKESEQR